MKNRQDEEAQEGGDHAEDDLQDDERDHADEPEHAAQDREDDETHGVLLPEREGTLDRVERLGPRTVGP